MPQQPAVSVNPSVFLSLMLTGFPSHKRVLLTRSLCSKAVRSWGLEPPLAKAAGGCLGLQTFLRSKSGGKKNQTLFEAAAPAFFGVQSLLPTPTHGPRLCLTQPFIYLCSRTFPKIYMHFNKKASSPVFPWREQSACGLQALVLGGEECGRSCRLQRRVFQFSPDPPSGRTLLATECKEDPRICRQQTAHNPGALLLC